MNINRVFPLLFWLCSVLSVQGQNLSDGFTSQEIPDSIWNLMQGKTYQPNDVSAKCGIPIPERLLCALAQIRGDNSE